jgi:hypothetical protein
MNDVVGADRYQPGVSDGGGAGGYVVVLDPVFTAATRMLSRRTTYTRSPTA